MSHKAESVPDPARKDTGYQYLLADTIASSLDYSNFDGSIGAI